MEIILTKLIDQVAHLQYLLAVEFITLVPKIDVVTIQI